MSCCDLPKKKKKKEYVHILHNILNVLFTKENLFTETLRDSDSECSTWPWSSAVYFLEALLLYHIGKG